MILLLSSSVILQETLDVNGQAIYSTKMQTKLSGNEYHQFAAEGHVDKKFYLFSQQQVQRIDISCKIVPQYQESFRQFASVVPCSMVENYTVCGTEAPYTYAYYLSQVDSVQYCTAVQSFDLKAQLTFGGNEAILLNKSFTSYKSQDLNITILVIDDVNVLSYDKIIIRNNHIFGVPRIYQDKVEFDVETYKQNRMGDIKAPLHSFSSLNTVNEDYFYDIRMLQFAGGCQTMAIEGSQLYLRCQEAVADTVIEVNTTEQLREKAIADLETQHIEQYTCEYAVDFGNAQQYIQCRIYAEGVYRIQSSSIKVYSQDGALLLQQKVNNLLVSGVAVFEVQMTHALQPLTLSYVGEVVIGMQNIAPGQILRQQYCPFFYQKLSASQCFTGCYNDSHDQNGRCVQRECPENYAFYKQWSKCVSYQEYYDLTGLTARPSGSFFQEYACGSHGAMVGRKCVCDDGYQKIDFANKIMCSKAELFYEPSRVEKSVGDIMSYLLDADSIFEFGLFGAFRNLLQDIKATLYNKNIQIMFFCALLLSFAAGLVRLLK